MVLIFFIIVLILGKFFIDICKSIGGTLNSNYFKIKCERINVTFAAFISLYVVLFLWHIWDIDSAALGFNFTVFWIFIIAFFSYFYGYKKIFKMKNLIFLLPIGMMGLSYSIYENPWLKVVTFFLLPVIFAFFINFVCLEENERYTFDIGFIYAIFNNIFSCLRKLFDGFFVFVDTVLPRNNAQKVFIGKILSGIIIFLLLALIVILPLLSSADSDFAALINHFYDLIQSSISWDLIYKFIFFLFFISFLIGSAIHWSTKFEIKKVDYKFDDLIAGIVIIGILALYLIFIYLQIEKFFMNTLPFEFQETERIVKSGFWELFSLSIINTVFYFFYYKKTNKFLQKILTIFSFASLLIVLSAFQRMFLYVKYYGLSYEKFFASYTVIYAVLLFICLIHFLFEKQRRDIFKFLFITFIWMFSITTILPVERIIFKTNLALSEIKDSRINLYEMDMLSYDVKDLVKNTKQLNKDWSEKERSSWVKEQDDILAKKQWYEKNLMNLIVK